MRTNVPWIPLLVGLLLASVLEVLIYAQFAPYLNDAHVAVRWLVTLVLVAGAVWVLGRAWFDLMRRPSIPSFTLAMLLVLLAFRLLAARVAELPHNVGVGAALLLGLGAGFAFWNWGRATPLRNWMAALFGLLVFMNLFPRGPV